MKTKTMSCPRILGSLVGAYLLLTLPAIGQIEPVSSRTEDHVHFRLVYDKIEDAKNKLGQLVRERHTFNPFRHKGDLAIVISSIGVLIGGLKLWVELRKRRAKHDQPPTFTPQAGPR